MKKKVIFPLALILVLLLGTTLGTTAGYSQKITAWFYDIRINLDSKPLGFYSQPFIYNGQVYVSINDIAKNMGFGIQWDNQNKVMNLSSNDNNRFNINTLQYELDQKNTEIANLKFQLSQKKVELDILRDHQTSSNSSSRSLNSLENHLEDRFDDHSNRKTMRFKNYNVNQLSNDNIEVKMYADFDKDDSEWKNRRNSDFKDFIEKICDYINDDYDEDIEVIVYDDDKHRIAEYEYDESRDRLTEEYTSSSSSSSSDENDLEDYLEDRTEYTRHYNDGRTLRFDDYNISKNGSEMVISIDGDFKYNDSEWQDLDTSDFEDFIENICEEVADEFNRDVKLYVDDKNGTDIATFKYDEDDGRIVSRTYYHR